jgi:hypothetical protein
VSEEGRQLFLGMIRRTDIARAYLRRVHGERTSTVAGLPGPAPRL